ncbi:MAG: acyl carrier protein [Gammaproteobacteria bacterium RIFCSPHIGHO2_12_FULL_40_19]|nr:MAG: acyl carrier protein [Gammaproteobacteria bacterium RIFCSPHIGHO2_12_FULL_40_19]
MDIKELMEKLENEFEDVEKGTIQPETNFKALGEWNSMLALIIIALIDIEYDVKITGDDLRAIETVNDLYQTVTERMEK